MKLKFFCPYWGSNALSFPLFFKNVKDAGYDGVEMSLPLDKSEKSEILLQMTDYGLEFIGQHHETKDVDPQDYIKNFRKYLYNLAEAGPLLINSQTGKDYFSFEDNVMIIEAASEVSKETGIQVIHETHRGKFSFALHITKQYLEKIPGIELGLDLSHWCNVAESLLHDQVESLDLALRQTRHIHARIGYAEGPQVSDPRLPEWSEAVGFHLTCWDKIVEHFTQSDRKYLTITPEFGPYPYMFHLPFTNMPVADQWEVNLYMKELLKDRYRSVT